MTPAEAIRALVGAWERGDPDELAALFTEDGVYEDPLKEERLVGRDVVRDGNAPAMAAIRDCQIRFEHLLEKGTVAFCEGLFASRLVDGSGRLDFSFALVVEMRDGKIARAAEYFDTRPLVR
jgi:ketosteroid isomerase-like protein